MNIESSSIPWAVPAAHPALDRVYRRISLRLLPFLLICYVLSYLDRVNISFAKLSMQQDLQLSDAVYGLGAGIFFIGYVLFEVPSNLWLAKVGFRRTVSRIMILWGLASAAMITVHDAQSFYVLRFCLGVFEAGFAPGMIFYLTRWYSPQRRTQVTAIVLLAGPVANVIGGPLSAWIMTHFVGVLGLAGWQWMFLIEGLPCVLLGVVAMFYLDETPEQAAWLSTVEKQAVMADLAPAAPGAQHAFKAALKDRRVYMMALIYFCLICGLYTVSFWLPSLLREAGETNVMRVGLFSAIPYIGAITAMVLNARSSDRRKERRWHCAIPAFVSAAALIALALSSGHLYFALASITVVAISAYAAYAVFWATPTEYLKGTAAAGGIAFINSIGAFGGFVSPTIIGSLKTLTGSLQSGMIVMSAFIAVGAIACVLLRLPSAKGV
jgi:D-galactonate transporter